MKKQFLSLIILFTFTMGLQGNNLQIFNVSLVNNDVANQTIQVQFDISWENSWRDEINWDAAWIFMKYRNADDEWKHVKLAVGGANNGTGTPNTIQVSSDLVGAFMHRSEVSEGTFEVTDMELRWNYGLDNVTNPEELEVRVFALEMVYVPEGKFGMKRIAMKPYNATGSSRPYDFLCINSGAFPVISDRWTPVLDVKSDRNNDNPTTSIDSIRIKGDEGIDYDADGVIDNPEFPTGYKAFYTMKYEITEDLYAGFLNTLNQSQIESIPLAGSNITLNEGVYFSSTPNRVCKHNLGYYDGYPSSNYPHSTLSLAEWTGLRPMSMFEYSKAAYGPLPPTNYAWGNNNPTNYWDMNSIDNISGEETGTETASPNSANVQIFNSGNFDYMLAVRSGIFATATSDRFQSGASYYGIMEMSGNTNTPVVLFDDENFDGSHGQGTLDPQTGFSPNPNWNKDKIIYVGAFYGWYTPHGYRYVRTAE